MTHSELLELRFQPMNLGARTCLPVIGIFSFVCFFRELKNKYSSSRNNLVSNLGSILIELELFQQVDRDSISHSVDTKTYKHLMTT